MDQAPTKDCEDWKKAGFCTAHSSMIVHCKKTCEFCSSGNKDKFSRAIYWVLMKSIFYIYTVIVANKLQSSYYTAYLNGGSF